MHLLSLFRCRRLRKCTKIATAAKMASAANPAVSPMIVYVSAECKKTIVGLFLYLIRALPVK